MEAVSLLAAMRADWLAGFKLLLRAMASRRDEEKPTKTELGTEPKFLASCSLSRHSYSKQLIQYRLKCWPVLIDIEVFCVIC